jgi:hypothetical protein
MSRGKGGRRKEARDGRPEMTIFPIAQEDIQEQDASKQATSGLFWRGRAQMTAAVEMMDLWRAALQKRDGRSQAEAAVETDGGGSKQVGGHQAGQGRIRAQRRTRREQDGV